MLKIVNINDYKLYILRSGSDQQINASLHNQCYLFWKKIWLSTLNELEGVDKIYSDDFTRHDFFIALTHHEKPIGLISFKSVDLKLLASLDDSWFKPWPRNFLVQIAHDSEKAIIPSWLSVDPTYRRSKGFTDLNIGFILSELISMITLHTMADVAFGTPRKDRSVNQLVQQAGAVTVYENISHHGVLVDLVCFFKENVEKHHFSDVTSALWKNRIEYFNLTANNETTKRQENEINI